MHNKDGQLGFRGGSALLGGELGEVLVNVLLQLRDGVAESRARVVDLVLNERGKRVAVEGMA